MSHQNILSKCSKPICVPPVSPQTYFVFSLNSMHHMFSKLLDSQDLTSPLIFVKSCPTVSLCFYGKNKSNFFTKFGKSTVYQIGELLVS
jgi:hypothetical protein